MEPICVGEGLIQHYGECQNDSYSMIIMFSDGYNHKTQPILLQKNFKEIIMRALKILADVDDREKFITLLLEYLNSLSDRFINHVTRTSKRKNQTRRRISETCSISSAITLNKLLDFIYDHHVYTRFGIKSMKYSSYELTKDFRDDYETIEIYKERKGYGMKWDVESNVTLINWIFDLHDKIITTFDEETIVPTTKPHSYVLGTQHGPGKHATCMFSCGGQFYYYDNCGIGDTGLTLVKVPTPILNFELPIPEYLACFIPRTGYFSTAGYFELTEKRGVPKEDVRNAWCFTDVTTISDTPGLRRVKSGRF